MLHSILQTAVDDELLIRNPCKIAGAGEAKSVERPALPIAEIAELADEVPAHDRAFVILAAFSGLRAGELAAIRVADLDLGDAPSVRVARRFYRVGGEITVDAPKSARGVWTVPLPTFFTASGRDVLDGYSQVVRRALDRLGRRDVRMHDYADTRRRPRLQSTAQPWRR